MMKAICLAMVTLLAGCDEDPFGGHGCTEIGCVDQLSLRVKTADDRWVDGAYAIELDLAGQKHVCTFTIPNDLPKQLGSIEDITCEPRLQTSYFQAVTTCTETRTKDAVSQSCTPHPGEWTLELALAATPDSAAVRVTRDGAVLLEKSEKVSYVATRPNGPECEPLCRQSQITWTLE